MPTGGIRVRTSGIMIPAFVAPAAAGFTGIGDIVAGAVAFYGTQAYTATYASGGGAALDLNNDGTGALAGTIHFLSNGTIDTSSADTLITAGNSRISQVYDHTGNGHHIAQANNNLRPQLQLTGLNNKPAMFFDVGRGDQFTSSATGTVTIVQPNSYVSVMSAITAAIGTAPILGDVGTADIWMGMRGATANFSMAGGAEIPYIAVPDANIHSLFGLASGAASFMQMDTSTSAQTNCGTTGYSSYIGLSLNGNGGTWNGYIANAGLWGSDVSANFNAVHTLNRTNWGF